MSLEIRIPEIGESIHEVQIGRWLKDEGDWIEQDEPLVEIESEKATLQVPAPESGKLVRILKRHGDIAEVGEVVAELEAAAATTDGRDGKRRKAEASAKKTPAKVKKEEKAPVRTPEPARARETKPAAPKIEKPISAATNGGPAAEPHVSVVPSARRALRQFGLSAEEVEPTGPGGRLLEEDVLRHVAEADKMKKPPAVETLGAPASAERREEAVPMSLIRRRIAERLVRAQQTAALLTTFNEIDMTAVNELRARYRERFQERHGVKLGMMSFFVKATIEALKACPELNAEIRENNIVYRNYHDIGFAVGGERGLVVPVLRNAERMSFADIERQIADMAVRAREGKLLPEDLSGGTFTITNGGVYGSLLSTPIVNPPQSGVLGLHAILDRPVARDGQVVIRPMMYVALTYDHRIVDGREAVTFLKKIKELLEDPAVMLLEM